MNKFQTTTLKLLVFIALIQVFSVQASLLISPMNVTFTDRERSAQVILINSGTVTRNYRMQWSEKVALPQGGYRALLAGEFKDYSIASPMLRLSPKQVKLKPGERQIIKIAARRPKSLTDGDYRSHLQFIALPAQSDLPEGKGPGSIQLKMLLSYSIPVIVRQGKPDYDVTIDSVKIAPLDGKKKGSKLVVSMSRIGSTTPHGSLKAFWQANNSNKETHVATLNGARLYSELEQATYKLFWHKEGFEPKSGKMRIVYEGSKEFKGITFAEKTINF